MQKKLFILIEFIIYLLFMISDYFSLFDTTLIKYLGIILCLLFCLINLKVFGIFSFSFTLLADYFLLVKDSNYEIGIASFIIVQIIYMLYLNHLNHKLHIIPRILIPIILFLFIKPNNLETKLALIYFPQLVINCISAFSKKKTSLLALGLLLFVGCDICVGLHNLDLYSKWYALGQWFFYLPSQVLIALSLK